MQFMVGKHIFEGGGDNWNFAFLIMEALTKMMTGNSVSFVKQVWFEKGFQFSSRLKKRIGSQQSWEDFFFILELMLLIGSIGRYSW